MAAIDSAATVPTAADLARDVGVTDRTLLRTFQEVFGLPPKRYLLLRELHAVRRGLRDAAASQTTVADVLVRHGIWEFGRFAARYRGHFGELPSETLRRAKA
jgi:AraC family ethanolamine operon transcriptional activator